MMIYWNANKREFTLSTNSTQDGHLYFFCDVKTYTGEELLELLNKAYQRGLATSRPKEDFFLEEDD